MTAPPGWYPDPTGAGRRYWDGARWAPAQPPPPTKKPIPIAIVFGAAALLAAGSLVGLYLYSTSGSGPERRPSTPAYVLEPTDEEPSTLRVLVDRNYTLAEITAIVADLQAKYGDRDDGYFVMVNCSEGGTVGSDNRLANARFAVGAIGAARTGLDDGGRDVSLVPGAQCPPVDR